MGNSYPIVLYYQRDTVAVAVHLQGYVFRIGVFCDVVECLLNNPVHRCLGLVGETTHGVGNGYPGPNARPLGEILGLFPDRRDQSCVDVPQREASARCDIVPSGASNGLDEQWVRV